MATRKKPRPEVRAAHARRAPRCVAHAREEVERVPRVLDERDVSRALPDVRDGLSVQAGSSGMHDANLRPTARSSSAARVVGDVMANYTRTATRDLRRARPHGPAFSSPRRRRQARQLRSPSDRPRPAATPRPASQLAMSCSPGIDEGTVDFDPTTTRRARARVMPARSRTCS